MARQTPANILREVKQAIRQPYAWPGGYPLYILMADGESLSIEAARDNWRAICFDTLQGFGGCWQAHGAVINWEDPELTCAHTGNIIQSAYGES